MTVVQNFCTTCGHHRLHQVWGKRDDESWYQFDSFRCHAPEAQRNFKPDSTGGVKIGRFCWDCAGRFWIQSQGNDTFVPQPRNGYFIYEDDTHPLNIACTLQTEWEQRLIAERKSKEVSE